MSAIVAKIRLFLHHAHDKLTTYVGLAVAGFSVLADKAQSLVDSYPSLQAYLPQNARLLTILHYVIGALGLLAVYTRVRRLMGEPSGTS